MFMRSITLLLLMLAFNSFAAQKAITDDGQTVILNSDQTWRFEESNLDTPSKISINSKKFFKSPSQTFRVKALPTTFGIYINPEKWTYSKDKENNNRLSFRSKNSNNSDIYGALISEGIEIEIEALGELALENAKEAAPDARILRKEYRFVNGKKILFMEMEGTIKSIKFKYIGYYSSNKSGSVQLLMYSSANIADSKFTEIESFLNGFVVD